MSELHSANGINEYRHTLNNRLGRLASKLWLAKILYSNEEVTDKLIQPIIWANRNQTTVFNQVCIGQPFCLYKLCNYKHSSV